MGVAKPVNLPSKSFPTRAAAKAWVRDEIKDHYSLESVVADPLHVAVLLDLLERDDDAVDKVGVGVKEFFIRRTALGKGRVQHVKHDARGVWIRRVDGTEEDWSYTSAIDQEGRQSDVKEALRAVLDEDRVRFREEAFAAGPVRCARTGELIPSRDDAEVRYGNPSWAQLTAGFVETQGGWDAIELTAGDGQVQIGGDLADAGQRRAWKSYWERYARPLLVKKPGR
ncbi:DUF3223 domain-containing protein [Actinotalea sp. Marseille-Q4924]|uniref:DUF3223 domain-containing protein n=1 Tax=Actinotalea sp. Marseille-Q4924 TaxID=2866571 RepID=UPI001CE4790A|nr:DUF3223 domain-containing protein [Actinotalea sp. Marseille-Q4924]